MALGYRRSVSCVIAPLRPTRYSNGDSTTCAEGNGFVGKLRRPFVEGLVSRVLSTIRCDGRCQIHPFTVESLPVPERTISLSEYHSTFDWFPQSEELIQDIDRKMEVVFHWKQRHGVQLFLGGWQEKRQHKCHLDLNQPTADGGDVASLPASLGEPTVFCHSSGRRVRLDSMDAPRRAA